MLCVPLRSLRLCVEKLNAETQRAQRDAELKTAFIFILLLAPLFADAQTRTYAGGFNTRWNTTGWHGHDQDLCPEAATGGPEACNDADYRNANLDNSIGFRFGHERDWFDRGPFKFLAGVEGSFTDSEYNLSQDHIAFFSASAIAGIDYEILTTRIGGRFGAGPFITTDGRSGPQAFAELTATVPIRRVPVPKGQAERFDRFAALIAGIAHERRQRRGFMRRCGPRCLQLQVAAEEVDGRHALECGGAEIQRIGDRGARRRCELPA